MTGSGAVNIVTRAGSNDLHGSAFFFWRDDTGAARIGQEHFPFDREQLGFNLGGPFIQDILFWFASYERNNEDAAVATAIPGFPQFAGTWPIPFDQQMALARVDWNVTRSLRAFARFTHNSNEGIPSDAFGGDSLTAFSELNNSNQTALGLDSTLGRFTHSFRFGYLNYNNRRKHALDDVPELPSTLDPAGRPLRVVFSSGGQVGPHINVPARRLQDNYELRYDGSFSFGRHGLRWGILGNIIRGNWFEALFSTSSININTANQAICGDDPLCYPVTGASIGNALGSATEIPTHGLPYGGFKNNRFHWYVADSWRAGPRRASTSISVSAGFTNPASTTPISSNLPCSRPSCPASPGPSPAIKTTSPRSSASVGIRPGAASGSCGPAQASSMTLNFSKTSFGDANPSFPQESHLLVSTRRTVP